MELNPVQEMKDLKPTPEVIERINIFFRQKEKDTEILGYMADLFTKFEETYNHNPELAEAFIACMAEWVMVFESEEKKIWKQDKINLIATS